MAAEQARPRVEKRPDEPSTRLYRVGRGLDCGDRLQSGRVNLAFDLADFYLSDPPDGSSYNVQTTDVERVARAKPKVSADEDGGWHKCDGQDLVESAIREILDEACHNAQYSGKYGEQQSIAPVRMPAGKLYGTGDLENVLGGSG